MVDPPPKVKSGVVELKEIQLQSFLATKNYSKGLLKQPSIKEEK